MLVPQFGFRPLLSANCCVMLLLYLKVVCFSLVRVLGSFGLVWFGLIWFGLVLLLSVSSVLFCFGFICFGLVWCGFVLSFFFSFRSVPSRSVSFRFSLWLQFVPFCLNRSRYVTFQFISFYLFISLIFFYLVLSHSISFRFFPSFFHFVVVFCFPASENGMRGLLRGLPASLMGIVPYSGTDLAIFYTLRAKWMAANPDAKVRRYCLCPWFVCVHDLCVGS